MIEINCPSCGSLLQSTGPGPGFMNREQWDATKAGDFFCATCPPAEIGHRYRYFWARDLKSEWQTIAVGNGPFGVTVIPVVFGPGETRPIYRICGPQPIGGAIVETGRERAVEIAAELNRLARLPSALAEDLVRRSHDRWEATRQTEEWQGDTERAAAAAVAGAECRAIAAMLKRGAIDL